MRVTEGIRWTPETTTAASAKAVLPAMAADLFSAGRRATAGRIKTKRLHEFRLVAKRFRYTVEMFEPIYGPALEQRLAKLRKLQQLLGRISDCSATAELVGESSRKRKGTKKALVRLLEFLKEAERQRTDKFLEFWRNEFDAPGEEDRWIRYLRDYAGGTARRSA
jgi:CHAD domain-containing protein